MKVEYGKQAGHASHLNRVNYGQKSINLNRRAAHSDADRANEIISSDPIAVVGEVIGRALLSTSHDGGLKCLVSMHWLKGVVSYAWLGPTVYDMSSRYKT